MTAMWLFATPCSIWWWFVHGSASSWWPLLTSTVWPQHWRSPPVCFICHAVRPMGSTSLTVTMSSVSIVLFWYLHSRNSTFAFSGTNLFFSMIIVLTSCFNIILAILRTRSSEGRQKAFSTCTSHMVAVTVFCGALLFMYLQPRTNHSLDTDKMASVFYTPVIPVLNPLIYSLRNTDVKDALKRFLDNPCQSFRLMRV